MKTDLILFKDLVELEFVQQPARKQMFVTSNPFFAFHDDVFPVFAKNAVAQPRFPYSINSKTIIPDNFFSSLEELNHISTVDMNLNGTEGFKFGIKKSRIFEETRILECNLFDGTTLVSFGTYKNGSLWIDSDYIENRVLLKEKLHKLSQLAIHLTSSLIESSNTINLEIFEEQFNTNLNHSYSQITELIKESSNEPNCRGNDRLGKCQKCKTTLF